jgi:ABC-type branched-subunit amino acid transport system substrate-binding protein
MSNALSGPTKGLGLDLKKGAITYFSKINEQGGINGKKINLISLDDGYEPQVTVGNTRRLIEQDKVFALFGYVGTPTSYSILPMLNKSKIPYLMPFTGADFLRKPVVSNIFNLRASYYQEAETQIDFLVNTLSLKKIALVIQADEFGLNAQKALINILDKYKLKPVVNARFKRNSNDINNALESLTKETVDSVIFVGTYQPFSHLINEAHIKGIKPVFVSFSFIASQSVYARLKHSSKVIISEVMPDPKNCQWQLCIDFNADMKKGGISNTNRVQLEGYLNAYIFSKVAQKCPTELTHECLQKEFERFSFKDKGLEVHFSPINHQGLQRVYLSFSEAAQIFNKEPRT